MRWNSVGRCGPNLWIIMIVPTKSTRFLTDNFQRIYMYGYDSCDTLYDYHIQDFMIMHLPLCARSIMTGVFITDISTVSV